MDQYLGCDKKILRQIIQNHEATFKYQVQQLHQLYRRQRELMDEIRGREIFTKCLQLQASESNHCWSQTWSGISQTTSPLTSWFLRDCSESKQSAVLNTKSLQGPPFFVADNFEEPTTACPGPLLTEKVFNEVKALSSRIKGPEIRNLDLQLPADESRDEDEGEQFEDWNVSKAPSLDSETTPVKTGDLSSFNLRCRNAKFLIDLNEPIHIEPVTSSSGPSEPFECHVEIMHNDPCLSGEAEPDSEVQKHCELVNHDGSSVGTNSSEGIDLNSMPLSYLSETEITLETHTSTYTECKVEYPAKNLLSLGAKLHCSSRILYSSNNEIPPASGIKFLALAYSSQENNSENVDETAVIPRSVHDLALDKVKCVEDNSAVDTRINDEFLRIKTHFDLNTGVTMDKPLASLSSTNVGVKSAIETELEAPVSPENKEGSPPRGKSEDILLETRPLMSEREEQEPFIELDEIAAETLVLISSSGAQEFNSSYCLYWFAEIISLIGYGNDLGKEDMKLHNSATDSDQGNLMLVGIDDFKAKMLRLSEEKTINRSRNVRKENKRGTLSGRSGRDRTFKDLHPIKSFNKTGSVKKNTGRKVCAKLKKSSKFSPSHVKKSMSSIMKEPTTCSNQGVLLGWGKIKKRQEGYRRQASKFLVIS